MKLYHTATSPFVRKVMIAAHELGLADQIEVVFLRPNALSPDPVLSRMNPLSKIPCLVVDDGLALFDSVVIAEYLDTIGGHRLIPEKGPARWEVLTRQALCDGILDAGIQVFYEKLHRPAELQWEAWMEGQKKKVHQGLDALEQAVRQGGEADPASGIAVSLARSGPLRRGPAAGRAGEGTIVTQPEVPVDLGWIAAAAAIGWLEFRDVVEVRSGRPALSAWYDTFCERPSMQATWPRA